MSTEAVPQKIREEYTVRKFGGPEPSRCREEDLIEECTIVVERGEVVSVTVTRPPGPPAVVEEG